LQVGGPGPVQGFAGPPGVEADQVDGGGCDVVFQAGFGQAEVAGAADAGDVGGLGDGALDPGADLVPALPGVAGLAGAGGRDGFVDFAGAEAELAAGAGRGGALGAGRAGLAGGPGELGQDDGGAVVAGRVQEREVAPWGQVTCWWSQSMLELQPIYARKKGEKHEVVATYDAEFRAGFDRRITESAINFMTRSENEGKPFYMYLPYTQVHNPAIPDPEYVGKTKHGNWADILTQMDDFTGRLLDTLDELGIADNTIVVWASDNGSDPTYRMPQGDPDQFGGLWTGFSGPWRGGLFTSLEGSNRTPCIVRWPGKVPAGKVSNELVHTVDWYTTLVLAAGGQVPDDRVIDGMDMRDFLLGDAEESGRDAIVCLQGNRLQAVKWHQWKVHLFKQDDFYGTWEANNMPLVYNLEWDPREEHQVDFGHGWVIEKTAGAVAGAFLKSLVVEPPIKPGTPDPYTPPAPGGLQPETYLQIGPIIQYVTSLHAQNGQAHDSQIHQQHGIAHSAG
jgi:arylsulfatase